MEFNTDQLEPGEAYAGSYVPYGCTDREILFHRPDPSRPSPPKLER